jgi:hypothetical protein
MMIRSSGLATRIELAIAPAPGPRSIRIEPMLPSAAVVGVKTKSYSCIAPASIVHAAVLGAAVHPAVKVTFRVPERGTVPRLTKAAVTVAASPRFTTLFELTTPTGVTVEITLRRVSVRVA